MGDEDAIGLTTKDSLYRLCKEIETFIQQHRLSHKHRKAKSWLYYSLHHTSLYASINWISGSILLICTISLIVAAICSQKHIYLIHESIFLQILLILSIALEVFDNKLRHEEVMTRVKRLVAEIRNEIDNIKWDSDNYPSLTIPFSPCITLQWTYRDKKIVNLPWALLVKDDIIIVRPGQSSPGYCEAIDKCSEYPLLHLREIYGPCLQNANEIFSMPKTRKPLENKRYRLLETPYLNNLKIALESALDRPVTPHNKQRHLVMVRIIERFFVPMLIILIYCINFVRYFYLEDSIGKASHIEIFLIVPSSIILPLLPVMFPVFWIGVNYLGMARFTTIFDETIITPKKVDLDDQENKSENFYNFKFNVNELWENFCDIFLGKVSFLPRTANILHVFGSVTALCCVDKKGILSWPNPTAEKVFFLHNSDNLSETSSLANLNDLHYDEEIFENSEEDLRKKRTEVDTNSAIGEVLDVTYNPNDPFKLHFDDTKWKKFITSLKPLGLSILLNTCNVNTQDHYSQFCSHITCEAMYNENLVPVTNRRCLCELAKEIGFLEKADKTFSLEQQLSTFRHLQPEMVRRDNKYARSLSMSTKLKFPFPHMFAVVVKELCSGSMQLLSQGTADIVLDSCVDYWDGSDICPLTPSDRKKVQDFYQRSSLTAYCTAFAYRPITKGVSSKLSRLYLELPSDSRHLYHYHRSPTPVHWDFRSVLEPKIRTALGPFYSTDSLLYNDTPRSEVADADSCFDIQCNQVLMGLVTMQYQAQADMVYLIEQLERACIRFVHFSKENELRSRVFSEKMGLESGWNCHISLLSDRNRQGINMMNSGLSGVLRRSGLRRKSQSDRRLYSIDTPTNEIKNILDSNLQSSRTMSFSAPSAINVEQTVVRFDTENCPLIGRSNGDNLEEIDEEKGSEESFQIHATDLTKDPHDWQSLSCLTDSTEHSAPINFDMSNRAKLPRGIDKIRPHIELIDNVPLLVSLFTDCTPSSTKEMLHIMQDYGEVVCVMGSSANNENIGIFMQADASVAIEPIYPQVCQNSESYKQNDDKFHPVELSRALNSVACSLSLRRENPISIYRLVMEARHYMACLWNATQFWLSCCLTLAILQFTAALFMLPPILTVGHVIWIICIVIPLLSISLIATKTDPDIMKKPQEKNQIIFNAEVATFVLWCYGSKLLPVIFFVVISFAGMLAMLCIDICGKENCTCILFYLPVDKQNVSFIAGWTDSEHGHTLYFTQNIILIIVFLHFVVISISFVHREHNIWIRSPLTNKLWVFVVILLIFIQTLFSLINILLINGLTTIPINPFIILFAFFSPFLTFGINELVKREEIKVNLRQQRRIRLEFGTKLGMNSPF